ncbi:hypothetical protein H6CHR_01570 [Variovorax sp. PBL-H6]|nr:hypothetical protein H6CHR_01570 [Variovorax sp. PBL-H6]
MIQSANAIRGCSLHAAGEPDAVGIQNYLACQPCAAPLAGTAAAVAPAAGSKLFAVHTRLSIF